MKYIGMFLCAAAVAMAGLWPHGTGAQEKSTGSWWRCASGYTLETNAAKDGVRCVKPAVKRSQTPVCPKVDLPGARVQPDLKTDAWGKTDVCLLAQSAYGAKPTCPRRFKMEVTAGPDRCVLNIPMGISAPTAKR